MGFLRRIIGIVEKHLTWLQLITGAGFVSAVGWISKLAAERTEWISKLGPYGILLASAGGVLLFAGIFLALMWGRFAWIKGQAINRWKDVVGDKFNPMEDTFQGQRINLLDLVAPYDNVIKGKTFIDCDILGPGTVAIRATRPNAGSIMGVTFEDCDWVETRNDASSRNCIFLEDCNFHRGRVVRLVIFIVTSQVEKFEMQGTNWITSRTAPTIGP